jgi:hypothetical protein
LGDDHAVHLALGDIVQLRKRHPCGSHEWRVVRLGADIGLVCQGCQHRVIVPRSTLARRLRAVVPGAADDARGARPDPQP